MSFVSFYLLNCFSLLNNGKNYRVKPNVWRLRYLTLQCVCSRSDENIFLASVIMMEMMAVISGGSLIYTVHYDNFITYIIFNPYIKQGCHYSFRDHQTETQFKLLSPNHRICEQHGWDLSLCLSKYWYFQFYWKLFFPSRFYSQLFEIKLFFFFSWIYFCDEIFR